MMSAATGLRARPRALAAGVITSLLGVALIVVALVAVPGGSKAPASAASKASASTSLAADAGKAPAPTHRVTATARPKSSPTAVATTAAPPQSPSTTSQTTVPSKSAVPTAPAPTASTVSLPEPVSLWDLNDDKGTTALDSMGVNPATGSNISWCGGSGNCATFNGTSTAFTTSGSVISTAPGRSFTVVAAVYMTALTPNGGSETILSQDGVDASGFFLQYSGIAKRWAFSRVTSDSDANPAGIRALSTTVPALYTWTKLVGVFNGSDNQLSLYVNGVLQGTATDTSPFAATGVMAIGRAQFGGQPTDWFNGAADDVEVFDVALTAAQVKKL
jgi:hypothetical protein